ncbi:MAG: serine/threonine protein kinase [Atopobiaceae bacterium]|nr:serine/threonine protein kinase [Atopobiaceae bacterium]
MQRTQVMPRPASPSGNGPQNKQRTSLAGTQANAPQGVRPRQGAHAANAQVLLGRYRVLEVNSQGGFGTVNVCWDARLQRRVAIKQMPLRFGENSPREASTLNEALAEARTSSMLSHPNIVTMFDFERDDNYSYLVMEYVDGLNLADFLARVEDGVLTFDECAHLVDSVASALAFAHENGVLHLDIKPANIMVDRTGTVKLADFGMASLASAAGYGGARGGTVGYMPPEQIAGDMVDERTDIFALSVVVWQALTGICPFAAQTAEQSLELIERGPSTPLSHMEPELAGRVEDTLLRALEPNPMNRTASVERFARDLVPALGNPQEGAASLHDLLNQAEPDEEPDIEQDWDRLHVPLTARVPWLPQLSSRALAAASAAWFAYQLVPYIVPGSPKALAAGVAIAAIAGAAWPPLAGASAIALVVAALVAQPSALGISLALIVGSMGVAWWIAAGRRSYLSGPALLAPSCLPSPVSSVPLSAFALGPAASFFTAAGGFLFYLLVTLSTHAVFYAEELAPLLRDVALEPRTWVMAAACGTSALVGSLISRDRSSSRMMLGQLVACLLLVATYALASHMENGNIATALGIPALVVALSLGATLCIVCALMGDDGQYQKGDE